MTFDASSYLFDNLPDQPYALGTAHATTTKTTTTKSAINSTSSSFSFSSSSSLGKHQHYEADIGFDCKLVPAGTATVTVDPEDGPPFEVDCRDPNAGLIDQKITKHKGPFCSCLKTPDQYCKDEKALITNVIIPQVWPPQCYKCTALCSIVNLTDQPGYCS